MKPKIRRTESPFGQLFVCDDGVCAGSGKTEREAFHAWQRWRAMKFRDDAMPAQQPLQPAGNRA
jgi:hypothetical protein